MVTYCGLEEVDYLVTDDSLDKSYQNYAKKNNIELIVAKE